MKSKYFESSEAPANTYISYISHATFRFENVTPDSGPCRFEISFTKGKYFEGYKCEFSFPRDLERMIHLQALIIGRFEECKTECKGDEEKYMQSDFWNDLLDILKIEKDAAISITSLNFLEDMQLSEGRHHQEQEL